LWKRELNLPDLLATGPKPFRAVRRIVDFTTNTAALRHARLWKPEIIHAHFGNIGWENLSLRTAFAAPLITSFYGFDAWLLPTTSPDWRGNLLELFAEGDIFLVEGPAFRQRLVDLGCAYDKIKVQRLGVVTDNLKCRRRNFSSSLRIAMVGRFTEKKGLVDGLAACAKASGIGIDLSVTIIGGPDGWDPNGQRIKHELLDIARSPEMSNRVHFPGQVSHEETLRSLAAHDVFLCPSKHALNGDAEGGLPVVLIEAMAMGLLCLGSRHCDLPEAIIHGTTGFLFEEGNVEQLATLIERVSRSPECALPMVAAGRKHVEQNFNQSCLLPRLGEIYQKLHNCRHRTSRRAKGVNS
jgi:colanic acid/amylovoran biosynthesis glycosyltransferase